MNRRLVCHAAALLLLALPTVAATLAGFVWFYEHGWFWWWLAGSVVCSLAGWFWLRRLVAPRLTPTADAPPPPHLAPLGQAAWRDVEQIAARVEADVDQYERLSAFGPLLNEVLVTVARRYHPRSDRPELEIPAPYALRIIELVSRDLRAALDAKVPGAHALTLNDLNRLQRLARLGQRAYQAYRLGYLLVNPGAGIVREIRDRLAGETLSAVGDEAKSWALGFAVRRAGKYAIDLYSGQLVLDEARLGEFETPRGRADAAAIERRGAHDLAEPLRIVVIGQAKAGKSSLVNALLGEVQAAVDAIPCTALVEPYILRREGIDRAIILDTAGYATADATPRERDALLREIAGCDLVLLACSAATAARAPDRELLDALRQWFHEHPERLPPPLVAVLTHIDLLRPRTEWSPPYDIAQPTTPKARAIRDAVEAVAADLGLEAARVAPVCTAAERVYNVDEALQPLILGVLGDADRVRYLRCLRELRDDDYWRRLGEQSRAAGRLAAATGLAWLQTGVHRLDDWTRVLTRK